MVNIKQNFPRFVKQTSNNLRTFVIRLENELYEPYGSNDFVAKHAHKLITLIKSMNLQPGFSEEYKLS